MTEPLVIGGLIAAIGLMGSATCSGMEMGFYCVNRVKLRLRVGSGRDRAADAVQRELDEPDRMLTTLLIWNNIFNNMGSYGLAMVLVAMGFSEGWVVGIQTLVLTPLLLVFGESLPKEVFRMQADRLPYRFVGIMQLFRVLAYPLLVAVVAFARLSARVLGSREAESDRRSQIAWLLKESATHGAMSSIQASLVDQAMELSRTTIRQHIVPLAAAHSVTASVDTVRVLTALRRAGHDPVIVFGSKGRVERLIVGIDQHGQPLQHEPMRIADDMSMRQALKVMAEAGVREAVVSRDGRDAGIVTMRRLMEPVLESIRKQSGR